MNVRNHLIGWAVLSALLLGTAVGCDSAPPTSGQIRPQGAGAPKEPDKAVQKAPQAAP
jgi:hypothetical protein